MNESIRPHRSRRYHQASLKRRNNRRRARVRRLKTLRALVSLEFWTRALIVVVIGICFAFWAKFALVYNVPPDLRLNNLGSISAYVTLKPWWFGPPVFDLDNIAATNEQPYLTTTNALIQGLGRYVAVVENPVYIWVLKR